MLPPFTGGARQVPSSCRHRYAVGGFSSDATAEGSRAAAKGGEDGPVPTQDRPEVRGPARPHFPPSNAAVTAALAGGRGTAPLPPLSARMAPAGQDMVGNGAVAAARRTEPGPRRPTAAEPARRRPWRRRPGRGLRRRAGCEGTSRPGRGSEVRGAEEGRAAQEAIGCGLAPAPEDGSGERRRTRPGRPRTTKRPQGKTANAEKMNEAKPKEFDKDAFITAVNEAIAEKAPKNLDEADKFADSGKADEVKGGGAGQGRRGQGGLGRAASTTTKAPPDTSAAVPQAGHVPLTPDQPPGTPAAPNPANAVPDKLPPRPPTCPAGPARSTSRWPTPRSPRTQLKKSNEPTFDERLGREEGRRAALRGDPPAGARGREEAAARRHAHGRAARRRRRWARSRAQRVRPGQQVGGGKGRRQGRGRGEAGPGHGDPAKASSTP